MRKWLARLGAALIVPGGLVVLAVVLLWLAWRWLVSVALPLKADPRVVAWAGFWACRYSIPLSLFLAVLHNEGASLATDGAYPVGDPSSPRGPSFGPGQVLRARVERLWTSGRRLSWAHGDFDDGRRDVYQPIDAVTRKLVVLASPADLATVGNERAALWASALMLREALDETGGDPHAAARRYNGFGAAAEAYAARADTFRAELGGMS